MKEMKTIASISALLLCQPAPALAQAPSFSPSRPVTAVAPYEPGGPVDIEGRMYTKKATELTGQQYIMEYRTGAGTRIGVGYVARAVPDGHTLLITNASFTVFPALYKDLPFDTLKDFAPLSQMSIKTNVLVVRASFPAKNFAEYVAYAKANPGKVNFAMLGSGSTTHLVAAWLSGVTDTKVALVPYKGGGPAMVDVVAGRVDAYLPALIAGMPFIKSGKVRPLGVITGSRSKLLPELPTIAEQGAPGLEWLNWTGFIAPRAVPAATLARLNDVFDKVAKSPDIISLSEAQGNVTVGGPSEPFARLIANETARWRKLAQENNIQAEE